MEENMCRASCESNRSSLYLGRLPLQSSRPFKALSQIMCLRINLWVTAFLIAAVLESFGMSGDLLAEERPEGAAAGATSPLPVVTRDERTLRQFFDRVQERILPNGITVLMY